MQPLKEKCLTMYFFYNSILSKTVLRGHICRNSLVRGEHNNNNNNNITPDCKTRRVVLAEIKVENEIILDEKVYVMPLPFI